MGRLLRRAAALCPLVLAPAIASASACPVTTAASDGPGSLRAALACADTSSDRSTVDFVIPGPGPHTIQLLSGLDPVAHPVSLRGPVDAAVTVDGSFVGGNGLVLSGDDCLVRDLTFSGFGHGVVATGSAPRFWRSRFVDNTGYGLLIVGSDRPMVGSTEVLRNGDAGIVLQGAVTDGVLVYNDIADNGDGVRVQGPIADLSILYNAVQGNVGHGVLLQGASGARVRGNDIGTDLLFGDRGNGGDGVSISGGGGHDLLDNVIAWNGGNGIGVAGAASLLIQGNIVGGEAEGNGGHGLFFAGGSVGSTVGGMWPGDANEIVGNQLDGIRLEVGADQHTFGRNRIRSQGGASISLGAGGLGDVSGNDSQLPAYILDAVEEAGGRRLQIRASQPDDVRVEVFMADPDGSEAWLHLGDATQVGPLAWEYLAPSFLTEFVTVATDVDGNSSALGGRISDDLTVTHTGDDGVGSLRRAITFANLLGTSSAIAFDLPTVAASHTGGGGVPQLVIALASPLPQVRVPLTVDACSIPLDVVLDGAHAPGSGLVFRTEAAGSAVRCLSIRGFSNAGIFAQATDMVFAEVVAHDNVTGLTLQAAARATVDDCDLSYNGHGLETQAADDLAVARSTFVGNVRHGLSLFSLARPTVHDSVFEGNGETGLFTDEVSDVAIFDNRSSGNGCHGILLGRAHGSNAIQGNVIGLDPTRSVAVPNGTVSPACHGILVDNVDPGLVVGGRRDLGEGNVVSDNTNDGIHLTRVFGAIIEGNDVGVGFIGPVVGNGGDGIHVGGQSSGHVIGGPEGGGLRNIVGGNGGHGLNLADSAGGNNIVQGNWVGANPQGGAFGNLGHGIRSVGDGDLIGGNFFMLANTVGFNHRAGISLGGRGAHVVHNRVESNVGHGIDVLDGATRNDISENRIVLNTARGIALRTATSNEGMPVPVFSSHAISPLGMVVSGTTDADGDRVELFVSSGPQSALRFVGSAVASAGGSWAVSLPTAYGDYVPGTTQQWVATATGRSLGKNTSELSPPYTTAGDPTCELFLPDTLRICAGDSVELGAGLRCGPGCVPPAAPPVLDCSPASCTTLLTGAGVRHLYGEVACTPVGSDFTGDVSLNHSTWRVCGDVHPNHVHLNSGSLLNVGGSLIGRDIGANGLGSELRVSGTAKLRSVYNIGVLDVDGRVTVDVIRTAPGGAARISGELRGGQVYFGGDFLNQGRIASKFIYGHVGAEGENACTVELEASLWVQDRFDNHGFVTAFHLVHELGPLNLLDGSRMDVTHQQSRRPITGGTGACAMLAVGDTSYFSSLADVDGRLDICDANGIENSFATYGPDVTFDCSCDVPSVRDPVFTWTPAAGLDDPTAAIPVATPTSTTTYSAHVAGPDGLLALDAVTVQVVSCP